MALILNTRVQKRVDLLFQESGRPDSRAEKRVPPDDEDDTHTTRRKRSPRLNTLVNAERPNAVGNAPHRSVALAAKEKAKPPRLVIKQHKLTRGYGAANLELQLGEWGYEDHSDWAEANNFAGAIICPKQAKHLSTET